MDAPGHLITLLAVIVRNQPLVFTFIGAVAGIFLFLRIYPFVRRITSQAPPLTEVLGDAIRRLGYSYSLPPGDGEPRDGLITRVALSALKPVFSHPLLAGVIVAAFLALSGWFLGEKEPISRTAALQFPPPVCRSLSKDLLIFLHGWRGDRDTSWQQFPKFVCEDPEFRDVEVWSLNYPTFIFTSNLLLDQTAGWINDRLRANGALKQYRRVIIVAHSVGGLIARRMLLERRPELSRVVLLIEIATPHEGAASYIKLMSTLGLRGQDVVEQVRDNSPFLRSLDDDWGRFNERPPTYCLTSPHDWLVSTKSALSQCKDRSYIPVADHRGLAKPESVLDDRYTFPMYHVKAALQQPEPR
jgi:pimeloyl-ACP methyl ester carboxylesterase